MQFDRKHSQALHKYLTKMALPAASEGDEEYLRAPKPGTLAQGTGHRGTPAPLPGTSSHHLAHGKALWGQAHAGTLMLKTGSLNPNILQEEQNKNF